MQVYKEKYISFCSVVYSVPNPLFILLLLLVPVAADVDWTICGVAIATESNCVSLTSALTCSTRGSPIDNLSKLSTLSDPVMVAWLLLQRQLSPLG